MKATVLFKPGKPLEVEDLDPPQEDEVVVGMAASGVCHSCLHTADGSWTGFPMPIVLGDEGGWGSRGGGFRRETSKVLEITSFCRGNRPAVSVITV